MDHQQHILEGDIKFFARPSLRGPLAILGGFAALLGIVRVSSNTLQDTAFIYYLFVFGVGAVLYKWIAACATFYVITPDEIRILTGIFQQRLNKIAVSRITNVHASQNTW